MVLTVLKMAMTVRIKYVISFCIQEASQVIPALGWDLGWPSPLIQSSSFFSFFRPKR
jgi:hypothetical protein